MYDFLFCREVVLHMYASLYRPLGYQSVGRKAPRSSKNFYQYGYSLWNANAPTTALHQLTHRGHCFSTSPLGQGLAHYAFEIQKCVHSLQGRPSFSTSCLLLVAAAESQICTAPFTIPKLEETRWRIVCTLWLSYFMFSFPCVLHVSIATSTVSRSQESL